MNKKLAANLSSWRSDPICCKALRYSDGAFRLNFLTSIKSPRECFLGFRHSSRVESAALFVIKNPVVLTAGCPDPANENQDLVHFSNNDRLVFFRFDNNVFHVQSDLGLSG